MDEKGPIDLPLKINPDPSIVYDYHSCLTRGVCLTCGKTLMWELEVKKNDDRFCSAICCTTKYSMMPEKVRIVASFAYALRPDEEAEDVAVPIDDDDFLRELEKMK